jgi:hypothetical protein
VPDNIARPDANVPVFPDLPIQYERLVYFLLNLLMIEFRAERGFSTTERLLRDPDLFTTRRGEAENAAKLHKAGVTFAFCTGGQAVGQFHAKYADGTNVYVFFGDFGMLSYGPDGNERWRLPLGPFNSVYGMAASPILAGDRVILPCDQDTHSFMIAVNKSTGRVEWRVDRPEVISGYSTPILHKPKDGPLEVIVPESFQLSAYSVETGNRVWYVRGLACEMKSIPATDGKVIYINGWGWPENQPGKQIRVMPFEEALRKGDVDKDGKLSLAEGVDDRSKNKDYFNTVDLDRDCVTRCCRLGPI